MDKGRYTMARGRYTMNRGKNTIGSGVYIPWLPGVNIPRVGGLTYHG